MADFELSCVQVKNSVEETRPKLPEESMYVNTRYGKIFVTIQGDRSKTPFLTYPDIGLNSVTQFHNFFNFDDNLPIMDSFCAYHLNAPGQEENAETLPANYSYPTMDQLAETVIDVINYFKLKSVICFGIGLGANVLARFTLLHGSMVTGCVFINAVSQACGWIEWGYQKWSNWYLRSGQYTQFTQNYLLWHHFGYQTWETNHDLIESYSRIFSKTVNPQNLSHLINSYICRTDLGITRGDDIDKTVKKFTFRCYVMNVMGDNSPHDDEVVELNGRLDPACSSFVKFADCGGMVLEEQPAKMAESLRHFLQGLGFVPQLSITRHSLANRYSEQAIKQKVINQARNQDGDDTDSLNNYAAIKLEEDSFNRKSFSGAQLA